MIHLLYSFLRQGSYFPSPLEWRLQTGQGPHPLRNKPNDGAINGRIRRVSSRVFVKLDEQHGEKVLYLGLGQVDVRVLRQGYKKRSQFLANHGSPLLDRHVGTLSY